MALWMDEPRLHDPNLFLDALPEIYQPALLVKIFQSEEVFATNFTSFPHSHILSYSSYISIFSRTY